MWFCRQENAKTHGVLAKKGREGTDIFGKFCTEAQTRYGRDPRVCISQTKYFKPQGAHRVQLYEPGKAAARATPAVSRPARPPKSPRAPPVAAERPTTLGKMFLG